MNIPNIIISRVPFLGRIAIIQDREGSATKYPGGIGFHSKLTVTLVRNGKVIKQRDLGSGLVTNVGVTAMANDSKWAAPSGASVATLALANQHVSGIGATAAAATDVTLVNTTGVPAAVAGTQSLVSAANSQKYRTVATVAYVSSLAITEWGLFTDTNLSDATGSPFTATTSTSGTATATPYTASSATVKGKQQFILVPATTLVYGLIASNTTSVLTIPAWYNVSNGAAGATPGSTEAFTIKPVLWDRKQFAAINVVNGDSIQFTYDLTVTSGG